MRFSIISCGQHRTKDNSNRQCHTRCVPHSCATGYPACP